jgi:tetratricopeptide (TPR) repeat protein
LKVGLGMAAREASRKATALEPTSASAWISLCFALQHDELGRLAEPGMDFAGAEAACRKAKALDPKSYWARFDLAYLLEHAGGARYAPSPRLAEALAEYRSLRADLGNHGADGNILFLLLHMGRHDELRAFAKETQDAQRDKLVVASKGMREGADAAVAEAQRRGKDRAARHALLRDAGSLLLLLRHYPVGVVLIQRAGNAASLMDRALAERQKDFKRRETLTLPADDPATVVKRMSAAAVTARRPEDLDAFFVSPGRLAKKRRMLGPFLYWYFIQRGASKAPLGSEQIADGVMMLSTKTEGDAKRGWRVTANGANGAGEIKCLLVPGPKGPRIHSLAVPEQIAGHLLVLAERGDLEAARLWFDWLRQALGQDDRLGGSDVRGLGDQAPLADIARVAALLVAEDDPRALAHLAKCAAPSDSGNEVTRQRCALGHATALAAAKRPAEALRALEGSAGAAMSMEGIVLRATALADTGKAAEGERILSDAVARFGDDARLINALARVRFRSGRVAEAREGLRRVIRTGKPSYAQRNEYAWAALLDATPPTDDDLEQARLASEESMRFDGGVLNTLAMMQAERGQLEAARDTLREYILPGMALESADRLVMARLLEAYGLADAARTIYLGITKPDGPEPTGDWAIAQRRLAKLAAK